MGYDVESIDGAYLQNTTVNHISWKALNVEVYDKSTSGNKTILSDVSGHVNAGMVPDRRFISLVVEDRASWLWQRFPHHNNRLIVYATKSG